MFLPLLKLSELSLFVSVSCFFPSLRTLSTSSTISHCRAAAHCCAHTCGPSPSCGSTPTPYGYSTPTPNGYSTPIPPCRSGRSTPSCRGVQYCGACNAARFQQRTFTPIPFHGFNRFHRGFSPRSSPIVYSPACGTGDPLGCLTEYNNT